MPSWLDMMTNPKIHHVKKTLYEILKDRYPKNENVIERIAAAMVTESDLKDFFQFVTDIYEIAYLKSVADHKEQLAKMGLTVTIVPERKS